MGPCVAMPCGLAPRCDGGTGGHCSTLPRRARRGCAGAGLDPLAHPFPLRARGPAPRPSELRALFAHFWPTYAPGLLHSGRVPLASVSAPPTWPTPETARRPDPTPVFARIDVAADVHRVVKYSADDKYTPVKSANQKMSRATDTSTGRPESAVRQVPRNDPLPELRALDQAGIIGSSCNVPYCSDDQRLITLSSLFTELLVRPRENRCDIVPRAVSESDLRHQPADRPSATARAPMSAMTSSRSASSMST